MLSGAAVLLLQLAVIGAAGASEPPSKTRSNSDGATGPQTRLNEAQKHYAAGRLRAARQILTAIDPNRLDPALALRYRRLEFDLNCESGQYQEALAAAAMRRRQLEQLAPIDAEEIAALATGVARIERKLGKPDAADEFLRWGLARLSSSAGSNDGGKRYATVRGDVALARIELTAELASQRAVAADKAMANPGKVASLWKQVIIDGNQWMSRRKVAPTIEQRRRCLEAMASAYIANDQRAELTTLLHKATNIPHDPRDPLAQSLWLAQLARQYNLLGDARSAAELFERGVAAAETNVPTNAQQAAEREQVLADLRFEAAKATAATHDSARIRELSQKAAESYKTLVGKARDVREKLQHLVRLEELAELANDLPEAIRVGREAIKLQSAELDPNDPRTYATRTAIASLCLAVGDAASALELAQPAWAFFETHDVADASMWGASLLIVSQAEQAQGNFGAPLARLKTQHEAWTRRLGESDLLRIKLDVQLADLMVARGEYLDALPILERAKIALEKIVGKDGEVPLEPSRLLAQLLLSEALAYDAQGQFAESLARCRASYQERARTAPADDASMLPYHLALCRMCLHQLDELSGEKHSAESKMLLDDARDHSGQAYEIIKAGGRLDSADAAQALYQRGLVRQRDDDLTGALEDWGRGAAIARARKLEVLQARLALQIGSAAAVQKDFARAEPQLVEAVKVLDELTILPGLHYAALCNYAQVLLALNRAEQTPAAVAAEREDRAIAQLRRAVDLIELPRAGSTGSEQTRARYFARYAVAFDLLVDLFSARFDRGRNADDFQQAMYYADRSRNRTLLDELWEAGTDLAHALEWGGADLLAKRDKLLEKHTQLEGAILAQQDRGAADTAGTGEQRREAASFKEQLAVTRQEYAALHARLQDILRRRSGGAAAHPVYEFAEWRKQFDTLFTPGIGALVYHTSASGSHLFLVARETRQHWRLKAIATTIPAEQSAKAQLLTVAAMTALVDGYRRIISDPRLAESLCNDGASQADKGKSFVPAGDVSLQSYATLVADAILPDGCRKALADMKLKRLIVVPDGPLYRLPLEALYWEAGTPPVFADERLPALSYTPSLMILSRLARRAAAGDGAMQPVLITLGVEDYSAWQRPGLAHARQESADIAAAFAKAQSGGQCRSLLDREATETNLRRELAPGRCTYLHLAAHADIDEQVEGLFGRILLARPKEERQPDEDGALYAHEVAALPLTDCQLVVLSACNTSLGPEVPLECAGNLMRAFLTAGARRVVASHWSVDDAATARLMTGFVTRIFTGPSGGAVDYADALREARAEVRHEHSAPYYWAPFVLYGPGD